ncbi:MAG: transposase [Betaproteobacteria bacterium]|nr:transposase [Betaproteobacteria bacterium]
MSRYRRAPVEGATYFFTVVTHHRRPWLVDDRVRAVLREAIIQTRQALPFTLDAIVLLPDHLHCIWTLPRDDADFGKRWGLIKARVSRVAAGDIPDVRAVSRSRGRRREHAFWQRRFREHRIRDEEDYARHVDYIHANPVKHGLAMAAADWPYSSFHRFVARGIYPLDWMATSKDDTHTFGE